MVDDCWKNNTQYEDKIITLSRKNHISNVFRYQTKINFFIRINCEPIQNYSISIDKIKYLILNFFIKYSLKKNKTLKFIKLMYPRNTSFGRTEFYREISIYHCFQIKNNR